MVKARLRVQRAEWLVNVENLRVVPEELVKSLTEFTHNPAVVYRYRNSLAEAIEAVEIMTAKSR